MQFTSIIVALSMALAATARPNGSPPTTPAGCTQSGGSVQCCTTSGISILECGIIPLATCGVLNGGQQACCTLNQSGILDIGLCSLL